MIAGLCHLSRAGASRRTVRNEALSQASQSASTEFIIQRRLVTAACMLAIFMAAVEATIVATAMPTIVADLGGFRLFSWVFAAYLLATAVSTPLYGRLADLHGRKPVFVVGAVIFLAGSAACGAASSLASRAPARFLLTLWA